MSIRAAAVCAIAWSCLSIGGCGGQGPSDIASAHERDQVREFLPAAGAIRCSHGQGAVTHCRALVFHAPGRIEKWDCEFMFKADREHRSYGGSQSCWSDNGTQESMRTPAD